MRKPDDITANGSFLRADSDGLRPYADFVRFHGVPKGECTELGFKRELRCRCSETGPPVRSVHLVRTL